MSVLKTVKDAAMQEGWFWLEEVPGDSQNPTRFKFLPDTLITRITYFNWC